MSLYNLFTSSLVIKNPPKKSQLTEGGWWDLLFLISLSQNRTIFEGFVYLLQMIHKNQYQIQLSSRSNPIIK